jgi:hypothetical protein
MLLLPSQLSLPRPARPFQVLVAELVIHSFPGSRQAAGRDQEVTARLRLGCLRLPSTIRPWDPHFLNPHVVGGGDREALCPPLELRI